MKKAILLLLVTIIALTVNAQDEVLLKRAMNAYQRGLAKEAIRLFELVIEQDSSIENYMWLAKSHFKEADANFTNPDGYLNAYNAYEKVYKMDSTNFDAYLGMANSKYYRVYFKRRDRQNPIDKKWAFSELDKIEAMYRLVKEKNQSWLYFEQALITIAEERENVAQFGK